MALRLIDRGNKRSRVLLGEKLNVRDSTMSCFYVWRKAEAIRFIEEGNQTSLTLLVRTPEATRFTDGGNLRDHEVLWWRKWEAMKFIGEGNQMPLTLLVRTSEATRVTGGRILRSHEVLWWKKSKAMKFIERNQTPLTLLAWKPEAMRLTNGGDQRPWGLLVDEVKGHEVYHRLYNGRYYIYYLNRASLCPTLMYGIDMCSVYAG